MWKICGGHSEKERWSVQNKGFSPPFDIFSPLVKATFQQFGTFLLMLMLLTRNSISFHFVRPPAPRPSPPTTNVQNLPQPPGHVQTRLWQFMDGTSREILVGIHLFSEKGNTGMEIKIEYGSRAKLGLVGIYGMALGARQNNWNIRPQVDVFAQASGCKKGPYSHKPPYLFT